jgi:hypothetical protein
MTDQYIGHVVRQKQALGITDQDDINIPAHAPSVVFDFCAAGIVTGRGRPTFPEADADEFEANVGPQLQLWEDWPYVEREMGNALANLPHETVKLSPPDIASKLNACISYRSQLRFQFGSAEAMAARIRTKPVERYQSLQKGCEPGSTPDLRQKNSVRK